MTLWSVDVSHLRIPVGPCSSCPWACSSSCPCPPPSGEVCSWGSSSVATPGGAMTSVTVQVTSKVVVGRIAARAVGVHPAGEFGNRRRVGLDLGLLGAKPHGVLGRRHGSHVKEHERVVEPTQLGALAPVDPGVQDVDVEIGD